MDNVIEAARKNRELKELGYLLKVHAENIEIQIKFDKSEQEGAISRLYNMKLDFKHTEESNDAPFFSEAYLYDLLGKEDGRTVLGVVRNLLESFGYNSVEIDRILRG